VGAHAGDITETAGKKTTPAHGHPGRITRARAAEQMAGQRIQCPGHNRCNLALKFKISSLPFPTALGTGVNTEVRRGDFPYLEDEEAPDNAPRACVCIGTIAAI